MGSETSLTSDASHAGWPARTPHDPAIQPPMALAWMPEPLGIAIITAGIITLFVMRSKQRMQEDLELRIYGPGGRPRRGDSGPLRHITSPLRDVNESRRQVPPHDAA